MRVKDLIKLLQSEKPNTRIVLASDAEGNSYSYLNGIGTDYAFDGESVGLRKLTPEAEEDGYTEEDVVSGNPVVVLWPA